MSGIGNNTTRVQTLARAIDAAEQSAIADTGLTVPQFRALEALVSGANSSVAALADWLGISRQAAQTLTSTLALKHLIQRSDHAQSGRALRITVTPAAREALEQARGGIAEVEQVFTSAFPPTQLNRFEQLLATGLAALPNTHRQRRSSVAGALTASATSTGR